MKYILHTQLSDNNTSAYDENRNEILPPGPSEDENIQVNTGIPPEKRK